jgi:putative membrane protein
MNGSILTREEHGRVAAAIRSAEERTSGEIICVLTRGSDSYFYPAAFALAVAMLVASLVAALIVDGLWVTVPLWQFAAVQIVALASALAVLWLWPAAVRFRRAHRNARTQFLARNIHVTENRTGVLIFLSLAEHYAEIVADQGINAHVSQDKWDAIVADLVVHAAKGQIAAGFEGAIAAAGALLANAFPPDDGNANELDDHLVEI